MKIATEIPQLQASALALMSKVYTHITTYLSTVHYKGALALNAPASWDHSSDKYQITWGTFK